MCWYSLRFGDCQKMPRASGWGAPRHYAGGYVSRLQPALDLNHDSIPWIFLWMSSPQANREACPNQSPIVVPSRIGSPVLSLSRRTTGFTTSSTALRAHRLSPHRYIETEAEWRDVISRQFAANSEGRLHKISRWCRDQVSTRAPLRSRPSQKPLSNDALLSNMMTCVVWA